jgi:hypothetical protein
MSLADLFFPMKKPRTDCLYDRSWRGMILQASYDGMPGLWEIKVSTAGSSCYFYGSTPREVAHRVERFFNDIGKTT